MRWFMNLGLKTKLLSVLLVVGVVCASVYSFQLYRKSLAEAVSDARTTADEMLERSTQMFLVSTKKFHDAWEKAKDFDQRKQALEDWSRTIYAVDDAVITDFGKDKPRVKLTGDKEVYGYRPLGAGTKLDRKSVV